MVLRYRLRRFGVECGCGLERGQAEQKMVMFSEIKFLSLKNRNRP